MKVEIDDRSGFCFGVVNAIGLAERSLAENGGRGASLGETVSKWSGWRGWGSAR